MQNKHQTFFLLILAAQLTGRGGGARWLGQMPKFFRKCILRAPLIETFNRRLEIFDTNLIVASGFVSSACSIHWFVIFYIYLLDRDDHIHNNQVVINVMRRLLQ